MLWKIAKMNHRKASRGFSSGALNTIKTMLGGKQVEFPCHFLRDNCTCPECYHPTSKQRLIPTFQKIPLDVAALKVEESDLGIHVQWSDGHESSFGADWLMKHLRPQVLRPLHKLWNASELMLEKYEFQKVIKQDESLSCFIQELWSTGLVLMKDADKKFGVVEKFGDRASCVGLRVTNYGKTFRVLTKLNPSNVAYTSGKLELHSDLCFYRYKPDIQMLHCIQQAKSGGNNTFVDAFRVARDFEKVYPVEFDLLSSLPFTYMDVGTDAFGTFDLRCERPLIEMDATKKHILSIHLTNHTRDAYMNSTDAKLDIELMDAYYKFNRMINDPKYVFEYQLKPGEIMTFDNNRVLHGRTAYNMDDQSNPQSAQLEETRQLEGGYLDWDLVYSKLRTLQNQ